MRLLDHARDVHSQFGEDGILEKILTTLGARDRWCVEFGAWDGVHLSNTRHLIDSQGYRAVLIEGDAARHADLARRAARDPGTTAIHAFVGWDGPNRLDTLLARTALPRDFDLLSIDIDGNDYHVWAALADYTPKLVCIEFNFTIPVGIDFAQAADPAVQQGASLAALVRLGRAKGYELVAATYTNGLFVRRADLPAFGLADNSEAALREDLSGITQVFCGYDGSIHFRGHGKLPWHGLSYRGRLRLVPRLFRRYPPAPGPLRAGLYSLYRKILFRLGRH
jgi:hypothetical protein